MINLAKQIFLSAIEHVLPHTLIRSNIKIVNDIFYVRDKEFILKHYNHIYILAAGKAAAYMAKEIEILLGERITDGFVVVKYGHGCKLDKLSLIEAAHPIPDSNGIAAAKQITMLADAAKENDFVICLWSGGASSLLADIVDEIRLEDLIITNELLVKCGAPIKEINTVRKHLSKIKGGQLAKMIYPATTISLLLSDVIGDPIDVIASGPTCADTSYFSDAWNVLHKYNLIDKIPPMVHDWLQEGVAGRIPETPKQGDPVFSKVMNLVIGNNKIALEAALQVANENGLNAHIITDCLQGDVVDAAGFIIQSIQKFYNHPKQKPICLLFGGEPTVQVTGNGLGGRNQHLALYTASLLMNKKGITILCAGTDGSDGPTNAAGAIVDCNTIQEAFSKNINYDKYLTTYNSYSFFEKAGGHVITGSTRTNVMDMIVVIIE